MFGRLFPRPARHPADVVDEIHALCRDAQIRALTLPGHLRRDFDLDCGCGDMSAGRLRRPTF